MGWSASSPPCCSQTSSARRSSSPAPTPRSSAPGSAGSSTRWRIASTRTAAPSRSSPAMPSWRLSGSRSRTRTIPSARCGQRLRSSTRYRSSGWTCASASSLERSSRTRRTRPSRPVVPSTWQPACNRQPSPASSCSVRKCSGSRSIRSPRRRSVRRRHAASRPAWRHGGSSPCRRMWAAGSSCRCRSWVGRRSSNCWRTPLRVPYATVAHSCSPSSERPVSASHASRGNSPRAQSVQPCSPDAACPTARASPTGPSRRW